VDALDRPGGRRRRGGRLLDDTREFLYCVLPTVCHIVAIIIFQWFPITPEVHAEIRAKLDARAASEG
jgi:hypothetical protein